MSMLDLVHHIGQALSRRPKIQLGLGRNGESPVARVVDAQARAIVSRSKLAISATSKIVELLLHLTVLALLLALVEFRGIFKEASWLS